jgi:hypothetical protein
MSCECKECRSPKKKTVLQAYELLIDIPGAKAGTVFCYDPEDSVKGSIGFGCLKLAWKHGNVQHPFCDFCAETHVFPGQMIKEKEWFEHIHNDGRYHL